MVGPTSWNPYSPSNKFCKLADASIFPKSSGGIVFRRRFLVLSALSNFHRPIFSISLLAVSSNRFGQNRKSLANVEDVGVRLGPETPRGRMKGDVEARFRGSRAAQVLLVRNDLAKVDLRDMILEAVRDRELDAVGSTEVCKRRFITSKDGHLKWRSSKVVSVSELRQRFRSHHLLHLFTHFNLPAA